MTIGELLAHCHRWCHEEMPADHPAGVRSLDLDPGGLTLADLDTALGARRASPRMPFADRQWWYLHDEAGAPYCCSVFAATPDDVHLSNILLRQDPPELATALHALPPD